MSINTIVRHGNIDIALLNTTAVSDFKKTLRKSKPCNNLRRRSEQSSQNGRHVVVNINHKLHAKYSLTFDLHQNALQGISGPQ